MGLARNLKRGPSPPTLENHINNPSTRADISANNHSLSIVKTLIPSTQYFDIDKVLGLLVRLRIACSEEERYGWSGFSFQFRSVSVHNFASHTINKGNSASPAPSISTSSPWPTNSGALPSGDAPSVSTAHQAKMMPFEISLLPAVKSPPASNGECHKLSAVLAVSSLQKTFACPLITATMTLG